MTALLASALVLGACGDVGPLGRSGKEVEALPADLAPQGVLGLKTASEDISASLGVTEGAYVEGMGLYSFRTEDELLQATLQVSKFDKSSNYRKSSFRQAVISNIGGARPRAVRVGPRIVYVTAGSEQQLAVWFKGPYLFVLATRDDYPQPRGLLRELLEVAP